MFVAGLVLLVGTATWVVASRSLVHGICLVLAVGYAYGLIRANAPGVATYLLFDVAVLGLYISQLPRLGVLRSASGSQLWSLWIVLSVWPIALFFFSDGDLLVELVGLRANIFLLPFLLLGACLSTRDVERMTVTLALLNLAAFSVAVGEFFLGLRFFLPDNEATALIYRSNDLLDYSAYRIPSTFGSAHAYAGTMVMTLPFLVGFWSQHRADRRVTGIVSAAIFASLVGVFMAATRTHMVVAAVLVVVTALSMRLGSRAWLRWAVIVAIGAAVVGNEARLQRFETLAATDAVMKRLSASVNDRFFDIALDYPLGDGLARGGTNLPHFLSDRVNPLDGPIGLENEYSRIVLEQGLPGLALWLLMICWVLIKRPGQRANRWFLGLRLAWVVALTYFVTGMIGIGLFVSVPQSCLFLMSIGWVGSRQWEARRIAHARAPAIVTADSRMVRLG